ncbi:MAG TPA: dTMP kinase [Blastocatellia bacterium]|nr:dTMP kinase [Blastocatellia bacterium]
MRGVFITLEGIDGSGKSTQFQMLADALSNRGLEVVVTREPGGTALGERMRAVLLSNDSRHLAPAAELFLMAADRAQDVAEVIRPALEAGRVVISDRYADSTVAFQGYGRGLDLDIIDDVNRLATGGLTPDLTVLFDLDPRQAQARLDARVTGEARFGFEPGMTRFDEEKLDFHLRVRDGYLKLASTEPERFRVLDAAQPIDRTHQQVLSLVLGLVETK